MNKCISVSNLTKKYKLKQRKKQDFTAVNNINFNIDKGECVGYIGLNGAGKSTTIKMLTGILTPTSGEVKIMGMDPIKDRMKINIKTSTIFGQRSQLWYDLPAKDTYDYLRVLYEIADEDYNNNLEYYIQLFDAKEIVNKPVRKLSLGEKMKCEIIGSLLHNPEIIFLDEPTIGLDLLAKDSILIALAKINEKFNTTIVLTSHDMHEIEKICSRIIFINRGDIIYDGSVEELKKEYSKYSKLKLNLSNPVKLGKYEGIVVDSTQNCEVEINFEKEKYKLSQVLSIISEEAEINDMKIIESDLEDIIKAMYLEEKSKSI